MYEAVDLSAREETSINGLREFDRYLRFLSSFLPCFMYTSQVMVPSLLGLFFVEWETQPLLLQGISFVWLSSTTWV